MSQSRGSDKNKPIEEGNKLIDGDIGDFYPGFGLSKNLSSRIEPRRQQSEKQLRLISANTAAASQPTRSISDSHFFKPVPPTRSAPHDRTITSAPKKGQVAP